MVLDPGRTGFSCGGLRVQGVGPGFHRVGFGEGWPVRGWGVGWIFAEMRVAERECRPTSPT